MWHHVIWSVFLTTGTIDGYRLLAAETDTIKISLSEVWEKAEEHSREIRIKEMEVKISEEEVKDVKMERLPEIGLKGTYERASNIPIYDNGLFNRPSYHEVIRNLYKVSADMYLNIYNGNKLNLQIRQEKILHEIAMIRKDETVSEIRYQAAALYLELQKLAVFNELIKEDIVEKDKQLQEIKSFKKHGTALENDVLKAELDFSKRKLLQIQIANDIQIVTQKLNIIIGLPDNTVLIPELFTLSREDESDTYEKLLSEAFEHSYSYNISEQQVLLSELNLKQVKANVRPKLGLTGDFYYMNPQIFLFPYNPYWYSLGLVGLKASLPISEFYHNIHKKRAAQLEIEKEHEAHKNEEDRIRQKINEAYLKYKELLIAVEVSAVNLKRAEENARIMKNNYFNQTVLITDLLDADVQVLQAKFELKTMMIEAQCKYYLLLNITGKL